MSSPDFELAQKELRNPDMNILLHGHLGTAWARLWLIKHHNLGSNCASGELCIRPQRHRSRVLRAAASSSAEASVWRPTLRDVDSLSRGDAAKERGTGSREIPHRLNADERKIYDIAKEKVPSILVLGGRSVPAAC